MPEIPLDIRIEAAIAAQELADMKIDDMLGTPSRFTCPECHGALWEIEDGSMLRFRCHVGHAFTADTVLASQGEEIDRLLGTLLRRTRSARRWPIAWPKTSAPASAMRWLKSRDPGARL